MDTGLAARAMVPGRITRATLTEQLEEAMRADILDGVFQPGQRLRASELTRRYGVSATPLREALQRLAVENLVDLDPRFGATVSRISESDLRDVYELLDLIGCLALDKSIQRGDDAWSEEVRTRFEAMVEATDRQAAQEGSDGDLRRRLAADAAEAHWAFHSALYQASDSPWLLRFVEVLHAHAERYRRLSMQASRRRNSLHEHEEIMLAARRGDREAAVAALREHLGETVRLLRETFGQERSDPA